MSSDAAGATAATPSSELAMKVDPTAAAADSGDALCCVCLEELDYNGSVMVRCTKCAIQVHVRCYGMTVPTDGSPWFCEACQYVLGKLPESSPADASVPRMQPRCAVCPVEGGALRLSNQPGVWSHVLCVNWIPELSHSLTGEMNQAVNIALLDRSRESLRCLVCGQRGGCIQCVSGRCARAFHVLCAIRAPSSLLFTGYNAENQQVYHCKTHLGDVATARYEMVDNSWLQLPRVQQFLAQHPPVDGKCRVCQAKTVAANQQAHEAQCLLAWLTREDLKLRREEMARRGLAPIEITYAAARGKAAQMNSQSSSKYKSGGGAAVASKKRQHAAMQLCPECGDSVRESQLASHIKSGCAHSGSVDGDSSSRHRTKNPNKMKRKMNGQSGASSGGGVVDLTALDEPNTAASDLSDVLFASWPGQSAGSPMDSTHLWRVVNSSFYSSKALMKRRMEPLCKSLCGAKLEDIGNLARKPARHDLLDCADTVLLDRAAGDATDALHLKAVLHRCDFMMRASRLRCPEDIHAQPSVQIRHVRGSIGAHDASVATPVLDDGAASTIRVRFASEGSAPVDCTYVMQVAKSGAPPPPADGAIWSSFRHDAASTLAGPVVEAHKLPLGRDDHLWLSMAIDSDASNASVAAAAAVGATIVPPQSPLLENGNATEPVPGQTDELTPEISLLIETLKEQMKQNRFRLRALSKKLQLTDHYEAQFQRTASMTESYYKELAAWKRLCKSLAVGYRDIREPLIVQAPAEVKRYHEHDSNASSPSQDDRDADDADTEPIDDGTCVVCFDGQSPETNPIVFCDRCDLAVHQGCYGIVQLPSTEFYCDRCSIEDDGDDPTASVFCQLCSLRDGAFKRTVDGKWVHVVCALWCPKVWIGNLQDLSEINLVAAAVPPPRFIDTTAEIAARLAAPTESGKATVTATATAASVASTTPSAGSGNALEQGSLCLHCRVACGRTIQCSHPGCMTSFHPLCGWFEGLPMTIKLSDRGFVYAGGGTGLRFEIHCTAHLPAHYSSTERLTQRRRRSKFRIDAFYVAQHSVTRAPPPVLRSSSPRHELGSSSSSSSLLSGPIVQALMSADSKQSTTSGEPESEASYDWIDRAPCGACFQYSSPILDVTRAVDTLHKRQFLMRCQYCSTFVHPECCLSDTGRPTTIFQSNWICERCTLVGQATPTPCLVCNKTCDYLMPCSNPPGTAKAAPHQSIAQRVQSDAGSPFDKWIHVLCSKWTKTKTVRKNRMLCAHTPSIVTDGAAVRCELCSRKGRNLVQCVHCPKRFHPICAAKKRLFIAKSARQDWRFYCELHPPADAVYDASHQAWMTAEILGQLQDLRRSLERGRMLLEMARQRDRQQKRLLNVCRLPFMEASVEIVLKKRPTPAMREAYLSITGEVLTDTPRRRVVQQSPAKRPVAPSKSRAKVASRNAVDDDEDDDEPMTAPTRRSSRGASAAASTAAAEDIASPAPRTRKRISSPAATTDKSKRRRLELELEPESPPSEHSSVEADATRRRSSTRRKLDTSVETEVTEGPRAGRGGMSPSELKRRFLRCLETATVASDFDAVVEDTFPEMLD